MSNPTYYDTAWLLAENGFGVLGADVFGGEWGQPDAQILLREGAGFPSDQPLSYEQPAIQVLVRGGVGQPDVEVYRRAKAVSDFLLSLPTEVEVNGACYKRFHEGSNLVALGKDENERFIYSANFFTWRNRL